MKGLSSLLIAFSLSLPVVSASDGESVESVVRALYETISGPAGPRDWNRFRALFGEGARMVPVRKSATGMMAPIVLTPEQFIERVTPNSNKEGFYESELASRIESFGNIAHVFSTYESRRAPAEKPFARGINSFQLVRDGNTWKIVTILWDAEREGTIIPERYLK
jgi:hypothetical protein